jgi:predicted secreted protein
MKTAMPIPSMIAIYFLIWVFCVFLVLPFGVRTADEAGVPKVPGQAESAPAEFKPLRVAIRVTVLATIIFALFVLNYRYGWVTPEMLDLFGGTKPVE